MWTGWLYRDGFPAVWEGGLGLPEDVMIIALLLAFAVFGAQAQTAPNTAAATASTTAPIHTASVTGCHSHEADVFCIDGSGEEVQMSMSVTPTGGIPAQFTGCHSHGSEQ